MIWHIECFPAISNLLARPANVIDLNVRRYFSIKLALFILSETLQLKRGLQASSHMIKCLRSDELLILLKVSQSIVTSILDQDLWDRIHI